MADIPTPAPPAPSAAWRAPGLAVLCAALLLLILPFMLRAWYGSDYASALRRAHELNDLLGKKIASTERALAAAVCVDGGLAGRGLPLGGLDQVKPPAVANLPPGTKPPATLRDFLPKSVVLVVAQGSDESFSTGSGFFIGASTIATNFHVVENAKEVFVINSLLAKPTLVTVRAHSPGTIGTSRADFAVLEIAPGGPSGVPMALTTETELMDNAIIAGYPGVAAKSDARMQRLLSGDLSAIPALSGSPTFVSQTLLDQDPALIGVNSQINRGNSGGPLVDYCGRVLGLNTFVIIEDNDRANYALASRGLMAFLDSAGVPYTKSAERCTPESVAALPGEASLRGATR